MTINNDDDVFNTVEEIIEAQTKFSQKLLRSPEHVKLMYVFTMEQFIPGLTQLAESTATNISIMAGQEADASTD